MRLPCTCNASGIVCPACQAWPEQVPLAWEDQDIPCAAGHSPAEWYCPPPRPVGYGYCRACRRQMRRRQEHVSLIPDTHYQWTYPHRGHALYCDRSTAMYESCRLSPDPAQVTCLRCQARMLRSTVAYDAHGRPVPPSRAVRRQRTQTVRSAYHRAWREQRFARGLCSRCGVLKAPEDRRHYNCRACRVEMTDAQRARYHARKETT